MTESIALSLLYLAAFLVIGLAAFCCGSLVSPWLERDQPGAPDKPADWVYGLLLRYGLGLGMLSACGAWLGLAGWLRLPAVAAATLTLAFSGVAVFIHRGEAAALPGRMRALQAQVRGFWRNLGCWEKTAGGGLGVFAALMVVNIMIGMMAPDMCQDAAMWYHLPVPGQWAITGRTEAFPWVFWSSLPLALLKSRWRFWRVLPSKRYGARTGAPR
ncbi:MAG: hypothetical protein NTX50_26175 [Candidatus Sumerlaeota bacterium]|nr:hypothetical protein [Candidatus Sumerlaeota bacterium]